MCLAAWGDIPAGQRLASARSRLQALATEHTFPLVSAYSASSAATTSSVISIV